MGVTLARNVRWWSTRVVQNIGWYYRGLRIGRPGSIARVNDHDRNPVSNGVLARQSWGEKGREGLNDVGCEWKKKITFWASSNDAQQRPPIEEKCWAPEKWKRGISKRTKHKKRKGRYELTYIVLEYTRFTTSMRNLIPGKRRIGKSFQASPCRAERTGIWYITGLGNDIRQ